MNRTRPATEEERRDHAQHERSYWQEVVKRSGEIERTRLCAEKYDVSRLRIGEHVTASLE